MRQSLFSKGQLVEIVREADHDPVAPVAKRHGVSEQTLYAWRRRSGVLHAREFGRLRLLEAENIRLIPTRLKTDTRPLAMSDRSDPFGILDQKIPCLAQARWMSS